MIRVHVNGALGRMGATCVQAVEAAEDMVVAGLSDAGDDLHGLLAAGKAEVMVDFTVPDAVEAAVRAALEAGCHVVCGTTGLARDKAEALGKLAEEKDLGFLLAPNFALGVILMQRFAREAVKVFPDVEILELHHEQKQDAPSGTALATARQIAAAAKAPLNAARPEQRQLRQGARGGSEAGIPIHSVRLPGLLAHQEVLFGGPGQVLTIRQDTLDRRAFMPGVLLGIREIPGRRGLVDSLEHLL
jgi:4-hydroxy-tetrahydrodipicolinate reductase